MSQAHSTPRGFATKPVSSLQIVATIPTEDSDWMVIGFGSLWAPERGLLHRVDPATHRITTSIPIGAERYRGIAIGCGAVWIPSCADNAITKVDPATNTVTGTYPVSMACGHEGSIAVGEGAVWVVTDHGGTRAGTLSRMDPATGAIVADIPIASDSHGVVVEGGFVFVTSFGGNAVTKVDPRTNAVVATIPVQTGPRFIASGAGSVWVLNQGTGFVSRIDPASGAVTASIDANCAGRGGDIAVGEGYVWTAVLGRPVTRIDPRTNTVVEQYEGDGFGDAIRAGLGYVWISGTRIWQVAPASLP